MITLKQLRHLQAICQHGTLNGAANAVHLTHSALTRSLQNLEEVLGVSLFERHKSGMQATPFCLKILSQSEQVLLAVKDIQRDAELEKNIEQGSLHILVGPGTKALVLRETLPEFFMRHPGIDVHITEAMPDEARKLLLTREADFLISGAGSFSGNEGLNIELIKSVPVKAFARKNHPLMGEKISWPQIAQYPLVAASYFPDNHPFLKILAAAIKSDMPLIPKIICSDTQTLRNILLKTDAWVIAAGLDILDDSDGTKVGMLDLHPFELQNKLSIIEIVGRSRSPAAQEFIDICKQYFNGLSF
jgi:DNA-binding transcriptional LysR family regulator